MVDLQRLSKPSSGATIATAAAMGTIRNDDVPIIIEASGATRLDQVANEYFLHDSAGNGPSLKYQGAAVMAGQSGAWAPVAGEKVGGGYQVAWQNGSADQYTVWNLDGNGNYTGNATGVVSGASPALEALESILHQDLNHDTIIG